MTPAQPSLHPPHPLVSPGGFRLVACAILTFVVVFCAYFLIAPLSRGWLPLVFAFGGGLAFAVFVGVLLLRRAFGAVHTAILHAQEGELVPIDAPPLVRLLCGPAIPDYNLLVKNMGSLFREMEQCQVSVIGERNRNDAILRSLPGVLLTVDVDFRITLSNGQAEQVLGRRLLGQNLFELLRLEEDGRELLREAFLYEQLVRNREITLTIDETLRHFTLNVTFFKQSPDARESCAAIMLQDITEYKRLQEVAYQAEKLMAMGQLAAGVAHELNTPLGTIIGYAKLINEGALSEARRQHCLQTIYGEAKRCALIIDNLLAYARRDYCQPETCDVNAIIREVVDTIINCQGRRYNLHIDVRLQGQAVVPGGPGQIDIVLVNLIMNAIQATAAKGGEPHVMVESSIESGFAVVAVTDNGPGMPPEVRKRVFDPFFTTKDVGSGTGLGLAISQSIVTRIGGALRCEAPAQGGARFVVTLPLAVQVQDQRA